MKINWRLLPEAHPCPYRKLDLGKKLGKVREPRRANHSVFRPMIARLAKCHLLGRGGSCRCSSSAPILRRMGLRRPVVRNGGAVSRPVATPPRIPFLAAESLAARASPSPTRDAFAIGDSNPSRKRGYDEARLHGTRSHGPGTRAEWNQSLARCRPAALFSLNHTLAGIGVCRARSKPSISTLSSS